MTDQRPPEQIWRHLKRHFPNVTEATRFVQCEQPPYDDAYARVEIEGEVYSLMRFASPDNVPVLAWHDQAKDLFIWCED